ncbi:MAG: HDOD domain-containing protein [Planctomycetaceae bacterium]
MPSSSNATPAVEIDIRHAAAAATESNGCALPVLPEVALQLLDLTADIDCDPADIVGLFRRDQSLTGHLLKTVNSARYSSGQTVTSIQQAVARMGLLQVREIVFLISCKCKVFYVRGFEDDVRRSFEKSLATAAFSQEIARLRRLNVEDAFLCGLLHDVGRPVLLQTMSDLRTASGCGWSNEVIRDAAAEFRVPMACRLVHSWDLPERISETIFHQSTPLEAPHSEIPAAMLNLAIDLADRAISGNLDADQECTHPLSDVLTLYPEDLKRVVRKGADIIDWVRSSA